ncbi:MAG: UrcA family protein [Candidatus Omnitrophica bacterium]|nr:UrcA family protein [Candidatus Omnitrophota bacterium]
MNSNYFKVMMAVTAAVLFTGISVGATETMDVRRVSGEIGWVDVQLGRLELNKETPKGTKTTAYRINQNETRVTDPTDMKYLNVADLRAGQYITIEEVRGQEDNVVPKIIVEPFPASEFQQAFGELKEIDVPAGTLVVEERVRIGQEERTRLSYFVFDPNTVVVMRSPSKEPVELILTPGDVVKVEFVELDGKQQARYITQYSPVVTGTSTTTTTTTTTTR